jgi:WD40 repeat protein
VWKTDDLEKPDPQPSTRLAGHDADVICLAFRPTGKQLLSAGRDGSVRLWDVEKGTVVYTLPHPAPVMGVAFHPSDGTMATACRDGTVRIWDPDGTNRLILDDHKGSVNCVAFTADGKRLISGSLDKTVIVYNPVSGAIVKRVGGDGIGIAAIALHGNRVAAADGTTVRIWNTDTGALLRTLPPQPAPILQLAYAPDGTRLAVVCLKKPVSFWDEAAPTEASAFLRAGEIVGLAYAPNGKRLATVDRDTLHLWDAHKDQDCMVYNLTTHHESLALAPTRPLAAVAGMDKLVHLWNWRTGEHQSLVGHEGEVAQVAFASPSTLVSADKDGSVLIWDVNMAKKAGAFATAKNLKALDCHGNLVVTGHEDGSVQFWRAPDGAKFYQGPGHKGAVYDLAFSPDGSRLASAGLDGAVIVCDARTGAEQRRWHDPARTPLCLSFSSDGRYLAAGDKQYSARVWDLQTGKLLFLLEGHEGEVGAVAFSHSNKRLASGGSIGDASIKLWDLATGLELLTLRGHGREVTGVAFADDDEALITLGRTAKFQGQLRVWKR